MYDPVIGRFTTPDPTKFKGGDFDLYRYVHNDPTNATDPSGLRGGSPGNVDFPWAPNPGGIEPPLSEGLPINMVWKLPVKNGTFTVEEEVVEKVESFIRQDTDDYYHILVKISFMPNKTCPESFDIKLVQVVRIVMDDGKPFSYADSKEEANRDKVMTVENKPGKVEAGWFVDHQASFYKEGVNAPLDYRSYWPNGNDSDDGSNFGGAPKPASLYESLYVVPKTKIRRYFFEVSARQFTNADIKNLKGNKFTGTGVDLGFVTWGFTIENGVPIRSVVPTVSERASENFNAAVDKFNTFHKNPK